MDPANVGLQRPGRYGGVYGCLCLQWLLIIGQGLFLNATKTLRSHCPEIAFGGFLDTRQPFERYQTLVDQIGPCKMPTGNQQGFRKACIVISQDIFEPGPTGTSSRIQQTGNMVSEFCQDGQRSVMARLCVQDRASTQDHKGLGAG